MTTFECVSLESEMDKLGYLIDVDGFELNKTFLVKELAIGHFDSLKIDLYSYKVGNYNDLPHHHKRQVRWVRKYIHGLNFDSKATDYQQHKVMDHIREICIEAEKNNKLIGYKGGHYELDILKSLGYRHLGCNIEIFFCPKLEVLFEKYPEALHEKCSNHLAISSGFIKNLTVAHCPKMEVYCFMRYVSDQKEESEC